MRKLKRKSKVLEKIIETPVKKKKIILYKKKKCSYIYPSGNPCKNNCVGNGNVCTVHGGTRAAEESLVSSEGSLPALTQKYNPIIHPLEFINLSRAGMSDVEIAAQFGVSSTILRKWVEKHKEFSLAHEIGQAMHEAWWLTKGKDHLDDRFFQTGLFKFLTGNKLGWSDKIETKNINQNSFGVLLVPGEMSVDEWEAQNIKDDSETIDIKGEVTNG